MVFALTTCTAFTAYSFSFLPECYAWLPTYFSASLILFFLKPACCTTTKLLSSKYFESLLYPRFLFAINLQWIMPHMQYVLFVSCILAGCLSRCMYECSLSSVTPPSFLCLSSQPASSRRLSLCELSSAEGFFLLKATFSIATVPWLFALGFSGSEAVPTRLAPQANSGTELFFPVVLIWPWRITTSPISRESGLN